MTNKLELELLKDISSTLKSLLHITRVISTPQVKSILESELDTEKKRIVYELLNGQRSVRDLEKSSGVNKSKISQWSQKWESLGLIVESKKTIVKGRREKVFDLQDYGIIVKGATK